MDYIIFSGDAIFEPELHCNWGFPYSYTNFVNINKYAYIYVYTQDTTQFHQENIDNNLTKLKNHLFLNTIILIQGGGPGTI